MISSCSLILIGAGGHCRSAIEIIEDENKFSIAGVLDTAENVGKKIFDYPIVGTDDDIHRFIKEDHLFLITIGHIRQIMLRSKIYRTIVDRRGTLATIVSPNAKISRRATVRAGTIVFHHAVLNANSEVGFNSIINTGSIIEHDCTVGSNCHIAPGATVNGGCTIGDNVYVGSGAVVLNGVSICSDVIVGAGAIIHRNIDVAGTYVGNPGKKIR